MNPAPRQISAETIRVIVRITLYAAACWITWRLMPFLMPPEISPLVVSTLSAFAAGALANGLLVRMYEGSRLSAFGMAWEKSSARELLTGVAGGAGAAAAIFLFALVTRMARLEFVSASSSTSALGGRVVDAAFVLLVLAFGAVGEELMFRGYAFQLMVRTMGEFAAVLPIAVLFGVAHMGNRDVTALAILNTVAWGILLGYAFLLTRALWLPIGLHYSWNAAMPLLGANLSGFTMEVRGYSLRWSANDWWSGGAYGFEGSVLTTMAVIALFFVLRRVIPAREPDLQSFEQA
jgi:membrane protease YdiL (CAAX protease family)